MPLNGDAHPFPKVVQLARGTGRYRRRVASPKQWAAIREAKLDRCRVCGNLGGLHLHHLVPRDWHGDDLADNLVPLCSYCHPQVTMLREHAVHALLTSLSDAEYAYAVGKAGEAAFERIYGLRYARV